MARERMAHVNGIDSTARLTNDFHALTKRLHACADPAEAWQYLSELAATAVDCDGANVIKAPRAHRPAAVLAASSDTALAFGHAQCAAAEGPSMDAATSGGMVTTGDLSSELRWPGLRALPEGPHPVQSVMSFRIAEEPCGVALSFHSTQPDAFDAAVVSTASVVATHAGTFALHQDSVRKVINLEQALETSRTIGAAVGIVMLARKLTPDQAFDVLREASQCMHVKIRDLAVAITETGELPQLRPTPVRSSAVPAAPASVA